MHLSSIRKPVWQQISRDVNYPAHVNRLENDNLRDEYTALYTEDVEEDIRWASIALGRKPDVSGFSVGFLQHYLFFELCGNSRLHFLSITIKSWFLPVPPNSRRALVRSTQEVL